MMWPWRRKRETRAGYSDLLLAALASGSAGSVLRTSALETAATLYANALSGAKVTGGRGALTPEIRHLAGRQLVRNGEALFVIRVTDGSVTLYPAMEWEVREGWRYRLQLIEPPGRGVSVTLDRDAVVHWRWAADPREPWRGVAPMASASLAAKVAANVETRLGQEAGAPSALLLPIPADGGAASLSSLRRDIEGAKGSAVLVETTARGWDSGEGQAGTRSDWRASRLGPEVPETLRSLNSDALSRVCAACGIPPDLAMGDADGTAQRESYRRFVMLSVEPLAARLAAEASAKLDAPVSFDFAALHARDIQGRATAYRALRAADMPDADARALTGLSVA